MIAAATGSISVLEMVMVILTPLGFSNGICLSKGGIHLILCLALLCFI